MPMPDLTRTSVGECPRLRSADIYDRRDAHCPDLSALFTRGDSKARHPRTGTNDDGYSSPCYTPDPARPANAMRRSAPTNGTFL